MFLDFCNKLGMSVSNRFDMSSDATKILNKYNLLAENKPEFNPEEMSAVLEVLQAEAKCYNGVASSKLHDKARSVLKTEATMREERMHPVAKWIRNKWRWLKIELDYMVKRKFPGVYNYLSRWF